MHVFFAFGVALVMLPSAMHAVQALDGDESLADGVDTNGHQQQFKQDNTVFRAQRVKRGCIKCFYCGSVIQNLAALFTGDKKYLCYDRWCCDGECPGC